MSNPATREDACLAHYVRYLRAEKNASDHTLKNYLMDIEQFIRLTWEKNARPPFGWKEPRPFYRASFSRGFSKARHRVVHHRTENVEHAIFLQVSCSRGVRQNQSFLGLQTPKRIKRLPKVMSLQEVTRLLDAPDQAPDDEDTDVTSVQKRIWNSYARRRDRAILELLYSTGMRIAELVGLTDDRIDFLSGVVKVRRKGQKKSGSAPWVARPPAP